MAENFDEAAFAFLFNFLFGIKSELELLNYSIYEFYTW